MVHNSAKNGERAVIHGVIHYYPPVIKGYTHPVYIYVDNKDDRFSGFVVRCIEKCVIFAP
jgi:hypothetical protein